MPRDRARHAVRIAALAALTACVAYARPAAAFCRTTTCALPPDFSPTEGNCYPPNFEQYCAKLSPPAKILPVYWRGGCIGYDIQQNASVQVPLATATSLIDAAFDKWTHVTCPAQGNGQVSISTSNLGPVQCDEVHYNNDQGNQNVIIFRDDGWPHAGDMVNTLGLTTITYDPDTGELYDADMELNSSVPLTVTDSVVQPGGYDFQSIIAHEAGHFFGMAHSGDDTATMFAHYEPGSTSMRTLHPDDIAGICSIYHPNGLRTVDPSTSASGTVPEGSCNTTPRHGFQSACQSAKKGCSIGAAGLPGGLDGLGVAPAALALAACARRRARARRM
jgi:hypothetical protein